jgi:hypothetical protein
MRYEKIRPMMTRAMMMADSRRITRMKVPDI